MSAFSFISPAELQEKLKSVDITLIDTRPSAEFSIGFVPGSLGIGPDGRYDSWAATYTEGSTNINLITPLGEEASTVERLRKAGVRNISAVLEGGFEAWQNIGAPVDLLIEVEPDELAMDLPHDPHLIVVDLRSPIEYNESHVTGAQNLPLAEMTDLATIANFEEFQNLYIHCGGGQRSVIAASLLKRQGIHNLRIITGGFPAIKEEKRIPLEKEVSKLN